MVATTTIIHRVTGTNNFITCWAPYFKPSSSSQPSISFGLAASPAFCRTTSTVSRGRGTAGAVA